MFVRGLLEREEPDVVMHLAGGTHTAPADRLEALNVGATRNLLEAMRPGTRMVLGSTGSVYGDTQGRAQGEDHPTVPLTAYAQSKLRAEEVAEAVAEERGISLVVARIFNVVGPGQPRSYLPGVLAAQLAEIQERGAQPLLRMGPLTTSRDYIDVRDVASALWVLAVSDVQGAVNVASGIETPVSRVLDILLELSGLEVRIEWLPPFPANVPRQVADIGVISQLGYESSIALRRSLRDLLDDCVQRAGRMNETA